jgi:hypothetical protein
MNTRPDALGDDPAYLYGADDYFAFVESSDPLVRSRLADPKTDPFEIIISERSALRLSLPRRAVWLDCVHAKYFMRLPWKDEICEIGNPRHAAVRREQLKQLDRAYFRAALLLGNPSSASEHGPFEEFQRATWHRVVLSKERGGLPVIVAPDFDLGLDERELRQLRFLGQCSRFERKSLTNAFSLDFLADANVGKLERGDPNTPPQKPSPKRGTGGIEKVIEEFEPIVIRHEEPVLERLVRLV